MNVNLTPPVEPSKIAPTAKSSAVSTDAAATESSGGFFAQLHALIFGSKTASDAPATSVTQTEGDTEAPVNTEAVLEADSDAALMAEMDDALFSASEVEAASEEGLPVDVIKSAQKAPSLKKVKRFPPKWHQSSKMNKVQMRPYRLRSPNGSRMRSPSMTSL